MNKNIILVIVIIILVGVAGYFALIREPGASPAAEQEQSSTQPTSPPTTESPESVNWENLIPTIQTVIGPTFLDMRVGDRPMSVGQEDDITNDDIPEALVYLGQGGAYTSYLTLIRIENEKPIVAQFKQKGGEVSPLMFTDGASVANGSTVVMLPDKNAIYSGHWSRVVSEEPYGGLSDCGVEAYKWNSQTKTFDFDLILSNEIRPGYCQKADI